jgi:FdhD protein
MANIKKTTAYQPLMSDAGLSPTHAAQVLNEKGELKQIEIAHEVPLRIVIDGEDLVTLMTLGTHPEELALGYLHNQRLITHVETIESVLVDWETGSVYIKTVDGSIGKQLNKKLTKRTVTSGCGQGALITCTLDEMYETKLAPFELRHSTVKQLLNQLAHLNEIYRSAGAVHACSLCSQKQVILFAEDVGRHNAADTIAGKMWLERISGRDKIFYTTGRLTSEIVMKVALMGIPVILSRSGITHMGLELAQELGMMMLARVKGRKLLIFNGREHFVHDL